MITVFKAIEHINLDKYKEFGYYIAHMQPLNLNLSRLPSDICDTPTFDKSYVYDLEIEIEKSIKGAPPYRYTLFLLPYRGVIGRIAICAGILELYEDKPTREQVVNLLQEMR